SGGRLAVAERGDSIQGDDRLVANHRPGTDLHMEVSKCKDLFRKSRRRCTGTDPGFLFSLCQLISVVLVASCIDPHYYHPLPYAVADDHLLFSQLHAQAVWNRSFDCRYYLQLLERQHVAPIYPERPRQQTKARRDGF